MCTCTYLIIPFLENKQQRLWLCSREVVYASLLFIISCGINYIVVAIDTTCSLGVPGLKHTH